MKISSKLTQALSKALSSLKFPSKEISLSPPNNSEFGDLSTSLALTLTKDLNQNPIEIANMIVDNLNVPKDLIDEVTVTKPGFINFKISKKYYHEILNEILNVKKYGSGNSGKEKRANVEFVSANPTGPLTIGHGRNAVLGDCIANILEWNGYSVTREYYYNDAGRQMRILSQSVEARYFEQLGKKFLFPEDGYQGTYIKNIAQSVIDKLVNEKTFYETGEIDQLLAELKNKDLIYEKDGATWFKSTALGKEQDRVYIKKTGEPTYRVPDTAYHKNKIDRGYDLIVDIFGADHMDTYPDVLLALNALGISTDHIKVLLYQFVTLMRAGEKVKMSTRKANFVTLDELVDEVGADVVRYFFIMRGMNSHLNFDIDLAKDQSEKNPVYYLQYAHARICNILKHADSKKELTDLDYDTNLLNHSCEIELIKNLEKFPEIIKSVHNSLEPHIISTYLHETANRFHKFYAECHVLTEDINLSMARIALVKGTRIVINNGLEILGISAPEKM